MPRKHAPTFIEVSHDDTRIADARRERARPAPAPEPTEPASWEAVPEQPAPPTPKSGMGKRLVIRQPPIGGAILDADEVFAMRQALMMREAHSTGTVRQAAIRGRQTLSRKTNGAS